MPPPSYSVAFALPRLRSPCAPIRTGGYCAAHSYVSPESSQLKNLEAFLVEDANSSVAGILLDYGGHDGLVYPEVL